MRRAYSDALPVPQGVDGLAGAWSAVMIRNMIAATALVTLMSTHLEGCAGSALR
jgi:hypothetical protein